MDTSIGTAVNGSRSAQSLITNRRARVRSSDVVSFTDLVRGQSESEQVGEAGHLHWEGGQLVEAEGA